MFTYSFFFFFFNFDTFSVFSNNKVYTRQREKGMVCYVSKKICEFYTEKYRESDESAR